MKARAKHTVKLIFLSMFVTCFIILNSGCGLDEYYVLGEPVRDKYPVWTSTDEVPYENRIFEFYTNENSDYDGSGFEVSGTNVYYKIYSSLSTCASEYSSLNTLVNSTSTKASSASSLINKFQKLKIDGSGTSSDVTIPHTTSKRSQRVRIRLTTYLEDQTDKELIASVRIGDDNVGIPIRSIEESSKLHFDFKRDSVNYRAPIPVSGDADTNGSSSTDGYWYVTLYAFSVGHDSTFTDYYSPIVHLGTLRIDANSYYN